MPQTFVLPRQTILADGLPAAGAVASFFQTGTANAQAAYTDAALTTAVTSLTADSAGVLQKFYLNPSANFAYRIRIETSTGALISQDDDISNVLFTQAEVGAALNQITELEEALGLTTADLNTLYGEGDGRRYGMVGDDSTDNDAAIANLIAVAAQGVRCCIPAGTYRHASTIELATADRMRIHGEGKVYLRHTGTGVAVSVNSVATGGSPHIKDLEITNIEVTGNANTTYCWDIAKVTRSKIDVRARNCTIAGMRSRFGVLNDVYYVCSHNEGAFTTIPVTGLVLEQLASGSETTTACNFNVVIEGVSGNGITVTRGDSNRFTGTSEGNGGFGIAFSADASLNRCVGLFLEVNGLGDVDCDGDSNTFQDCTASTRAPGSPFDSIPSYNFGATARLNAVIGGFCYSASIEAGALNTTFLNVNIEDDINDAAPTTSRTAVIQTRQGTISSEALPSQIVIMDAWASVPALQNSWAHVSGTWSVPQFTYNRSTGEVILRGQVGGGGSGTVITTLGAGFRPAKQHTFTVPATAGSADAVVEVQADGDVKHVSGDTTAIELSTVRFFTT